MHSYLDCSVQKKSMISTYAEIMETTLVVQ